MSKKLKPCPFCGSEWTKKEFGVFILWHKTTCVFGGKDGIVHSTTIDDSFVLKWNTRTEPEDSELLTISYMSGQADEATRHRKTREALNSLLHYIDHAGTWTEGWNMEKVRGVKTEHATIETHLGRKMSLAQAAKFIEIDQ